MPAEHLFATNLFTFVDDDEFVELFFQYPFSAINNIFLNQRLSKDYKLKFIMHILLKKNNPKLLNYTTDHGFAKKYLFNLYSAIFVGSQLYIKSKVRK